MNWITLDRFPFPPSTNRLYSTFSRNGMTRRVPSKELADYKKALLDYGLASARIMQEIRATFNLAQRTELELDIELFCPYFRLYCKDGKPKRFDGSNRIKALEDGLFALLGADDSLVRRVTLTKSVSPKEGEHSWALIKLRPFTPLNLSST